MANTINSAQITILISKTKTSRSGSASQRHRTMDHGTWHHDHDLFINAQERGPKPPRLLFFSSIVFSVVPVPVTTTTCINAYVSVHSTRDTATVTLFTGYFYRFIIFIIHNNFLIKKGGPKPPSTLV